MDQNWYKPKNMFGQ